MSVSVFLPSRGKNEIPLSGFLSTEEFIPDSVRGKNGFGLHFLLWWIAIISSDLMMHVNVKQKSKFRD